MRRLPRLPFSILASLALVAFASAPAFATWWHKSPECDPDSVGSGTVEVTDDVTGGFWSFSVEYEVFSDDNCANPNPVNGSYTYVYQVTLTDQSTPISLEQLQVLVDDMVSVTDVGVIGDGPGVAPESVTVSGSDVVASFASGDFTLGDSSLPIVAVSPFRPGEGQVSLEVSLFQGMGAALVPSAVPEASPCGPFFWKLKTLDSFFVRRYFPDGQFDQIAQLAADNSTVFDTADEVQSALFTGFFTFPTERAERELAALLLNLSAGELFPANTKCRLFFDSAVDTTGDGSGDTTVGEQLVAVESNTLSGDLELILEAARTADALNEARGLVHSTRF